MWSLEGYVGLAFFMLGASIWFTIINFIIIRKGAKKIAEAATKSVELNVFRKNNFDESESINSTMLVPGDIFEIEANI